MKFVRTYGRDMYVWRRVIRHDDIKIQAKVGTNTHGGNTR